VSLGTAREKFSTSLDWINVSYRSVYLVVGGTATLVVVLVCALIFRGRLIDLLSPSRREARVEIAEAQHLLTEASAYAHDSKMGTLIESAGEKLKDSQQHYSRRNYRDARTSAILSQNYSQKMIDIGRGDTTTTREVRFYRIEGEVRVKRAGQFHWEDATPRMLLKIGDQIKTGSSAGVQILYFDGTITTVRPESLLEIKDLYEEPGSRERRVSEKLNWGEVETATRKANVAGSYHEIQSVGATAKSREDSEFKVSYNQKSSSGAVSLFTGRVDVSTSAARVTIKGGETVAIQKGVLGAVEKLPPAPRLLTPSDQKIFVYGSPAQSSTTLAWEPVTEGTRYHLQVSLRSLFGAMLVDKSDVRSSTVELPGLPAEAYYWRVATVDARGRNSPFSSARKFRISTTEIRDRSDKMPPPLAIQDFIQNGPYVILNGKTEYGATLWVEGERVDVDDNGVFYAVVRLKKDGLNQVQVVAQDSAGNETRKALNAYVESY